MEQDHCKLAHEADIQRAKDPLKEVENALDNKGCTVIKYGTTFLLSIQFLLR